MRRVLVAIVAGVLSVAACGSPPPGSPTSEATMTDLRLHQAATEGDIAEIAALLAAGLPIDARDEAGRTPVMAATAARQTGAVKALVDAGADVDIRDDRLDNPFLYAGAEGLLDILRIVNEAGADPALTNRFGGIALIPASERGHVEMVRALLERTKVDVDHVNDLGWTALLEAVILGDGGQAHRQIVHLLLEHGADRTIADPDGVTPLEHARRSGYAEIVEILSRPDTTG